MVESIVQVTEGSGKKLHTNSYTVGANTVEDEFTVPGEFPYASYFMQPGGSVSTATANSHILQIMAGASLKVRIRRIVIVQFTNATTAAPMVLSILRLTTAGTGGTAITARPHDSTDAAAGAAGMTLSTVKGTEGVELIRDRLVMRQAVAATATQYEERWVWEASPYEKSIVIPAGTTNGIVIKNVTAIAAGDVIPRIEFVETAF